ncbi:hypothetical protein CPB85DRAFT_1329694 [Mucidula mucida]|nr:hypothetical protein CPB85DRAFT_1440853 [Mucidula mucida]KAF8895069.1 hypothetical protein CPB85DRAFT_1329694 [Mucidula mucida]
MTTQADPRSIRHQRLFYEVDYANNTICIAESDDSPHQEVPHRHNAIAENSGADFPSNAYFVSDAVLDRIPPVVSGPYKASNATYWTTAASGNLAGPPAPAQGQDPGHVLVHTNTLTGDRQVWVLNVERNWMVVPGNDVKGGGRGFAHPVKPDAWFKLAKGGKPSWVRWDTLRRQGLVLTREARVGFGDDASNQNRTPRRRLRPQPL